MGSRTRVGLALLTLGPLAGCQPSTAAMSQALTARMSMIDFSGLAPAKLLGGGLDASAAIPRAWPVVPPQQRAMFSHCQWRNATRDIGVGVVHIHLPLPMSAKTLVWLAKSRYAAAAKSGDSKSAVDGGPGELLGEWTDAVGREWVEGENDRFHVKGYAVTCGFDAWVVYVGVRRGGKLPNPVDLQLAERSMESVVPGPLASAVEGR